MLVCLPFEVTSRTALVDAEFSFGRWSGHDCASLEDPLKVLTGSIGLFPSVLVISCQLTM